MSLLDTLREAREGQCAAKLSYLTAKEDLRAAENLALDRRTEAKTLGTNADVRRSQIDGDCAAERDAYLAAELDLTRAECALAIALDSVSPFALT